MQLVWPRRDSVEDPASHLVQAGDPFLSLYCPGSHRVHMVAFGSENSPAPHKLQVVVPFLSEYCPPGQTEHTAEPVGDQGSAIEQDNGK